MKNYMELAHSTSASVEPVRARLSKFALTYLLMDKLQEFRELGRDLDKLKRAIFYGNPVVSDEVVLVEEDSPVANAHRAFKSDQVIELLHAGLGMATESAEFLNAVADHIFDGMDLDEVNLAEEIGDNQWYAVKACKFLNTTLELEQVRNIAKLAARFPNKFNDVDALNRDLARERGILEQALTPDASSSV